MPSTHHRLSSTEVVWHIIPGEQVGQFTGKLTDGPEYSILSLFTTPGDIVWIAGWFGGVAYDHGQWIEEVSTPLPRFAWFHNMLWSSGDDDYLLSQSAGHWHTVPVPFRHCHALKTDPLGVLIAAPQEGLWFSRTGSDWERFALPWSETFITNFWTASPGTLVLQTRSRHELYQYQWQHAQVTAIELPRKGRRSRDAGIITVCPNRRGGLWVSFDRIGLWHWDGTDWEPAPWARDDTQSGLSGFVEDLCFDHRGRLWAATDRGVCLHDNGIWHPLMVARDEPDQSRVVLFGGVGVHVIRQLAIDSRGRLWGGTNDGEVFWIDTTLDPYTRPLDYPTIREPFHPITLQSL
jgi:hypothetical protein